MLQVIVLLCLFRWRLTRKRSDKKPAERCAVPFREISKSESTRLPAMLPAPKRCVPAYLVGHVPRKYETSQNTNKCCHHQCLQEPSSVPGVGSFINSNVILCNVSSVPDTMAHTPLRKMKLFNKERLALSGNPALRSKRA